ncbi:MAG: toll/interleukin-1 receptor domain-containing protein [Muribaculaceae bacterium]|nr:toll/interleukin-1 receptor domain-containing protein [Muribaculaceae bacterium]
MIDIETLQTEIARIKQLRANYDALITDINSHRTIEAYHSWYDESSVVFSHYFDDNCKEYSNFTSVDNNGNGYELKSNYQKIRKDFSVLVDKLEREDFGTQKQTMVESVPITISSFKKRIFISHASKDRELIDKFVDSIFLLGMGVDTEIIAYTSREDTGVTAGKSIPQFIQENIACADIVLLMISDNYKNSEVCLNEMGAAWALNKHIIQILLPNTSIDKLGWLCSLEKAIKIDNAESMDGLCEVLSDRLDIGIKPSVWNRNKAAFILYCTTLSTTPLPVIIETEVEEDYVEELGFLDYRESIETEKENVSQICTTLSDAILKHNDMLNSNTRKLQSIDPLHPNISQAKGIMRATANGMNKLSVIFEDNTPSLRTSFFNMIDYATKMRSLIFSDCEETMEEEYNEISELLKALSEAKFGCIEFKNSIDSLPKAEQTFNKSKKQLSNSLANIIKTFEDCISKGQEFLRIIL